MIEYANESVIKTLKQYDMLSKSLKYTIDPEQRQDVCIQMTRIISKVLEQTNEIYEEKYEKLVNRSTYLMDEEKNRLLELINLINERRTYVNNQISSNLEITGISPNVAPIMGEDKLEHYKKQAKIIEKYKNNIKLNNTLKSELEIIEINIKKANDKIESNKYLNKQLEDKMINILEKAFEKLDLYELQEREKEIDLAYTELGFSLEKAKENAKIARKDCTPEIIQECDNMLASITLEYERYKEKKLILKLIEIYKDKVNNYDELLEKREKINNIMTNIPSSELYLEVGSTLSKQYATIKLEKQDIATITSLKEEQTTKKRMLVEINTENESDEFKGILSSLLENEKKYQEQLRLEKKKEEEKRKAQKIEEAKIKHQEMIKRQKLLEEERKKEIEERTKQLLKDKQNPVLSTNKTSQEADTKKIFSDEITKEQKIPTSRITKTEKVKTRENRIFKEQVNIKPSEDIFSRELNNKKVKDGIPVIKNNHVISSYDKETDTSPFPEIKLDHKEDIFPQISNKEDSFFNDEEFKDLNNYMEDSKKNTWF